MKLVLLLAASLFASPLSYAAKDLRCTVSLLHSQMDDGSGGLWVPPAAGLLAFDHDAAKEEIIWLKLHLVVPPRGNDPAHSISQWGLQLGHEGNADFALDFSKKDYNGEALTGRTFGLFLRTVKQWNNPAWLLSNGKVVATSLQVPVTEVVSGYLVVNCLKK